MIVRKRLFTLILSTLLTLSLTACGQNKHSSRTLESDATAPISSAQAETPPPAESSSIPETTSVPATEPETQTETSAEGAGEISYFGPLKVTDTQLTDREGNPVQLRGISTHGLAWYPDYVNQSCFQELHDRWHANVIRLAMYTAEYGGYCNGGDRIALKELIDDGVTYATELDMYAIIDWHILSDNNPNTHKSEAVDFFDEMSKKYADHDNILYEICNEPNGSTSWSDIKSYALEIIPVIRANDPDAVILVGTPNWSQYVDQAAADPILVYDNIMYTLHFYADTHRDDLRSRMENAVQAGLPVFVSEYGICDASGGGAVNTEQANLWIETLDRLGISYVAWNLSNKEETSAILKSSCTRTSGFETDDLSSSGRWLYEMLSGEHLPPASEQGSETAPAAGGGSAASGSGTLNWSAELVNSWSSEGATYYQYNLTLTNNTGAACTGWAIEVPFHEAITLSDGWNGDYSVSGNTLYITSKDYNGSVPAGETVTDVGFIVRGGGGIKTDTVQTLSIDK